MQLIPVLKISPQKANKNKTYATWTTLGDSFAIPTFFFNGDEKESGIFY